MVELVLAVAEQCVLTLPSYEMNAKLIQLWSSFLSRELDTKEVNHRARKAVLQSMLNILDRRGVEDLVADGDFSVDGWVPSGNGLTPPAPAPNRTAEGANGGGARNPAVYMAVVKSLTLHIYWLMGQYVSSRGITMSHYGEARGYNMY